ncbi:hypothetical protein LCGC14_1886060 [marine sediment metagenome]|uniref:Uncharacterized protein n=1 Tax=marine sediment metagenome TaxID=412755 RepID=A0A0F9IZ74_9ZZZZ
MSKELEAMLEYIAMGLYFRHEAIKHGIDKVTPWHEQPLEKTQIYWDDAQMVLGFKADGKMRIAVVKTGFGETRYPNTKDEQHLVEEIL